MKEIRKFQGQYGFLSNFYPSEIIFFGAGYPTAEHAYQAQKTNVSAQRDQIRKAPTASVAKAYGRKVTLRPDWEDIKLAVMGLVLEAKFNLPDLRHRLMLTHPDQLVEGNYWHDLFWGQCDCVRHQGAGENWLGKLLMKLRNSGIYVDAAVSRT